MKKQIIVIMKFIPAPAYSGGAKRNLAWLKFLSKYYKIHLVGYFDKTFKDSMISELKEYDINIYGFNFNRKLFSNAIKSIVLQKSLINLQYYNRQMQETIKTLSLKENIEFILCEELAMMNYCYNLNIPIYFDDHNIEYILMGRTAKYHNTLLKLFLYREKMLIKKEELKAFQFAKKIFVVSDNDKDLIERKYQNKTFVVNNTYPKISKVNYKDTSNKSIVFIGNVSWKPNKHGLNHFIKNIFPIILQKNPKVVLNIVGSSIPKNIKQLQCENIKIYENLSEKDKNIIIDNSAVCIVPVYFGGGTRIKILEYWAHFKPVVSTTIGAEGLIETKGTFICDQDNLFAKKVIELLNNSNLRKNSSEYNYDVFINNYCEEKVYEDTLYSTINTK